LTKVLFVISSDEEDPVAILGQMSLQGNLPACYRRGFMDPNIPKICLVLADASSCQLR
jgi:hypothetical protein